MRSNVGQSIIGLGQLSLFGLQAHDEISGSRVLAQQVDDGGNEQNGDYDDQARYQHRRNEHADLSAINPWHLTVS